MRAQRSGKKVVSRNVAIALGIISIVFLVGLVGAILNYTSIISGKDNDISTRDSQIQTLTNQKNQLQTWLEGNKTLLNQTQTWLQGNNSIANLAMSKIWVNSKNVSIQANNAWNSTPFTANYAGYISVQVTGNPSTTGNFYVQVTYSSHGVNYDNQIYVGVSGTAVFPVLPTSIQIRVKNLGTTVANATVTIMYYY
jgi:hypothetical protein